MENKIIDILTNMKIKEYDDNEVLTSMRFLLANHKLNNEEYNYWYKYKEKFKQIWKENNKH